LFGKQTVTRQAAANRWPACLAGGTAVLNRFFTIWAKGESSGGCLGDAEASVVVPAGAAERTGKDLAQFQRPIALGFNRSYDCLDFSSWGETMSGNLFSSAFSKVAGFAGLFRLQAALNEFQKSGSAASRDQLIEASQQVLDTLPAADPRRAAVLINLAQALVARFRSRGAMSDLQQAVETAELAVAATPPPHNEHPIALASLCQSLAMRFRVTSDRADLDQAIERGEEAVAGLTSGGPGQVGPLGALSAALKLRFELNGSLSDLDRSIKLGQRAVDATPPGDPSRASTCTNLGIAVRAKFDRTGDMALLNRAVEAGEEALAAAPPGYPDRPVLFNNLARALAVRFVRTGDTADADRAISLGTEAVRASGPGLPDFGMFLANLCSYLTIRYERTGQAEDLDLAVERGEEAAAAAPPGHPERGRAQAALSAAYFNQYKVTGVPATLDKAISEGEQAAAGVVPDGTDQASLMSNLCLAFRNRFERTGSQADLDSGIEAGVRAVGGFTPDDPRLRLCQSSLGSALRARYERAGALADLDQAIEFTERALAGTAGDDPLRAGVLSNLAVAIASRFERTGTPADLDRAIEHDELALAATPGDQQPDHARRQSNLGTDLHSRFDLTRSLADLDRAIELEEQAVAAIAAGNPERAAYLGNLGIARRARYAVTGDDADLRRAVEAAEQALDATPADHPDRTGLLRNLAVALRARFRRSGAAADRDAIMAAAREATGVVTAAPSDRARAAQLWGEFAVSVADWDAAVAAYAAAAELLALVAPRSLGRRDQEYWLREMSGLAEQAAAACLQAGQLDRAVELWEQCRGVLLGQALDLRSDLDELAQRHPGLAAEFSRLRDEMDGRHRLARGGAVPEVTPEPVLPLGDAGQRTRAEIDQRRSLYDAFDRVIKQIRAEPGFSRFLLPPLLSELLPPPDTGPVIVLQASAIRCDAIILRTSGAELVPLPRLTAQEIYDQAAAQLSAVDRARDAGAGPGERDMAEQRLAELLGWLWDAVAAPVLGHLAITGPPAPGGDWPRIWWCPSGLLTFLPLHAAGHHGTRFDDRPETVTDRAVSSFTPTLRALRYARRPPDGGRPAPAAQLLVVAMPHTPAAADLPGAEAEASILTALLPGQTTVIEGPRATHGSVLGALPGRRWAHFACHAVSDLADPSASHLLLSDHREQPLTVLDLMRLDLKGAELAFLSACATARAAPDLPDEAIQLAAGFQLAGYRHVIATLWAISDPPAVRIAENLYKRLNAADTDPAVALHAATRRCRNLSPRRPTAWAAHTHNGA
jgi:tetratricopeptide (TPR) repeat protein